MVQASLQTRLSPGIWFRFNEIKLNWIFCPRGFACGSMACEITCFARQTGLWRKCISKLTTEHPAGPPFVRHVWQAASHPPIFSSAVREWPPVRWGRRLSDFPSRPACHFSNLVTLAGQPRCKGAHRIWDCHHGHENAIRHLGSPRSGKPIWAGVQSRDP